MPESGRNRWNRVVERILNHSVLATFLNPFRTRRVQAAVVVALVAGLAIGSFIPAPTEVSAKETNNSDLFSELKIFTDVLALVKRDYVEAIGGRELVEGAIKGMLATLDPHSGYLDPDFYKDLQAQTKGEFGGLGIEITIKEDTLVVVAPMEDSPAERAGVKAGDKIIKIEDEYTKDFTLFDAVKKLRGPKGSKVTISVLREGFNDLIPLTIIRDKIVVESVKKRFLGDGFGYARISQFVEKTGEDLEAALAEIKKQAPRGELRGLVLDMRNNPGGLLTQAIKVRDLFLSDGVIVYTDGRLKSQKQKYFAHPQGTEPNYPIIVLVNGGSASASEIVSGALKDHGRALILGTQTFGKGSVQTISALANGGALTLTTALYYTKSGRSIQALGVSPDVIIENTPEESEETKKRNRRLKRMRERDLPGALRNPTLRSPQEIGGDDGDERVPTISERKSIDPEKTPISEWVERDPQFRRALELLKTFNIFTQDGTPTLALSAKESQS